MEQLQGVWADSLNVINRPDIIAMAFWNAVWLFIGIVAGALVQYFLTRFSIRWQAKNAHRVLLSEVNLNISELRIFRDRLSKLVSLVGAGQATQPDLFINMLGFDYSVVNPLVGSGHFHLMLGPELARKYFEFMRFFNNQNAQSLTQMLEREHQAGTSLRFLGWLEQKIDELEKGLPLVQSARLKRGRLVQVKN